MNEGGGAKVTNCVQPSSSGLLVSSPTYRTNRGGTGIAFNGSSQYLLLGGSGTFNFERTDKFSGVAWIYLNSTSPIASTIMGKNSATVSPFTGWTFQAFRRSTLDSTSLTMALYGNAGGGSAIIEVNAGASKIAAGNLYQVGFSYDGSSTAAGTKLYINGVQQTNTVVTDALVNSISNTNSPMIAARDNATPSQFLNGHVNLALLYGRELKAADFQQLYAGPYAMFAPRRPQRVMAAATASGLAIPAAMYHYQQQGMA